ncbi:hypothetical protein BDV59DRAFT_149913 [Aspergillus ambiguus]|uniref:uncharacterized protein n=1 Tax=Aspergillus ambiguus TaxID=176160 RepID=UPI003CCCA7EB
MPTYPDVVFEMSVSKLTEANFPALQQKFRHALYRHNVENEGSSILCWAAGQGRVSLMDISLDKYHADVNAAHGDKTPLITAVMSGSLAAVEYVLLRSELVLNHFNQGNRALWYSTAQKDPAIAQRLLCQPGINRPLRAKNGKLLTIFNEAVIRTTRRLSRSSLPMNELIRTSQQRICRHHCFVPPIGDMGRLSKYCWETQGLTPCAEMLVDAAPSTARQRTETCKLWTSS